MCINLGDFCLEIMESQPAWTAALLFSVTESWREVDSLEPETEAQSSDQSVLLTCVCSHLWHSSSRSGVDTVLSTGWQTSPPRMTLAWLGDLGDSDRLVSDAPCSYDVDPNTFMLQQFGNIDILRIYAELWVRLFKIKYPGGRRFVAPQKYTLRLRQPKLCKPESSAKTNTFASSGAETCSAFVQASFLSLRFDVAHAYWRAAEEADHVSESAGSICASPFEKVAHSFVPFIFPGLIRDWEIGQLAHPC